MPKTCYCGLKSSEIVCKYTLFTPLLTYIFVKNVRKKGRGCCAFFLQSVSQGGTGEFMYKVSILGNKQLLSSIIDREAT